MDSTRLFAASDRYLHRIAWSLWTAGVGVTLVTKFVPSLSTWGVVLLDLGCAAFMSARVVRRLPRSPIVSIFGRAPLATHSSLHPILDSILLLLELLALTVIAWLCYGMRNEPIGGSEPSDVVALLGLMAAFAASFVAIVVAIALLVASLVRPKLTSEQDPATYGHSPR